MVYASGWQAPPRPSVISTPMRMVHRYGLVVRRSGHCHLPRGDAHLPRRPQSCDLEPTGTALSSCRTGLISTTIWSAERQQLRRPCRCACALLPAWARTLPATTSSNWDDMQEQPDGSVVRDR